MERIGEHHGPWAAATEIRLAKRSHGASGTAASALLTIILVILSATAGLFANEMRVNSNDSRDYFSASVFDSRFVPPHSDLGIDENGNGLYDKLVIRAQVDIVSEGDYEFGIELFAGLNVSGNYVGSANASYYLFPGLQHVDIAIESWLIRATGVDCNYTAKIYMENGSVEIDKDLHTTSFYIAAEFDRGDAFFEGPCSDYVLDLNGNSRYDLLVVTVSLNVTQLGEFYANAWLDAPGRIVVGFVSSSVQNMTGIQIVQFNFSGNAIYHQGLDGPYTADVELYEPSKSFSHIDNTSYVTAGYRADDFEPDIGIARPVSDLGLDTDGDGLFNHLAVDVPVYLASSGYCDLYGTLRPNPPFDIIATAENYTYMDAGLGTMRLVFDGRLITNYGSDGPYLVQLVLWPSTGYYTSDHTTQAYLASQFEKTAHLQSPLISAVIDSDSDSLYESLVVRVTVVVEDEGDYILFGTLYNDSLMIVQIDEAGNFSHLSVGSSMVEIQFNGWKIRNFGASGIYYLRVKLCVKSGVAIDSLIGNTSAYLAEEFDLPPEPLMAPWFETFESGSFGVGEMAGWWASIPQAVTIGSQTSETGTRSLAMCGSEPYVEVVSPLVNVSAYDWVEIRFWIQVGSSSFSEPPDWHDQFYVYYWNSTYWVPLEYLTTAPPPGDQHVNFIMTLGNASSELSGDCLQLRFVAVHGDGPGTDYWHIDNIYIGPSRPPTASLDVSTTVGDLSTVFEFNGSFSWDIETLASQLEYRWDWDGDGSWDTSWTTNSTAQHQFGAPGIYQVRLEIRDPDGNTNTTTIEIIVVELIPEFSTTLIPVMGFVLLFVLMVRGSRETFGQPRNASEPSKQHSRCRNGSDREVRFDFKNN